MHSVKILSSVYSEENYTAWFARPSIHLLRDMHTQGDSARWIAAITTPSGLVERIAIGDPLPEYSEAVLALPQWFCMDAGYVGDGSETASVRFERSEDLPRATEIVVETIGDIPDGMDVRELLEHPLSELGVLQEDQMLPIPCLEGQASLRVKATKPAACVFLDGNEIALHFFEQHERVQAQRSRTPTPMPTPFFTPTEGDASMLPSLPALPTNTNNRQSSLQGSSGSSGYIPFGGVGRRLGST